MDAESELHSRTDVQVSGIEGSMVGLARVATRTAVVRREAEAVDVDGGGSNAESNGLVMPICPIRPIRPM